jgi:hypothetical protein
MRCLPALNPKRDEVSGPHIAASQAMHKAKESERGSHLDCPVSGSGLIPFSYKLDTRKSWARKEGQS